MIYPLGQGRTTNPQQEGGDTEIREMSLAFVVMFKQDHACEYISCNLVLCGYLLKKKKTAEYI
jgi:hypothetical protein